MFWSRWCGFDRLPREVYEKDRGLDNLGLVRQLFIMTILGCTVCMGGAGGPLAEAANGAIFLMLGLLLVVFGCLILGGLVLARRGARPIPEHFQLLNSIRESEGL